MVRRIDVFILLILALLTVVAILQERAISDLRNRMEVMEFMHPYIDISEKGKQNE